MLPIWIDGQQAARQPCLRPLRGFSQGERSLMKVSDWRGEKEP